jgi:hypothetical protein
VNDEDEVIGVAFQSLSNEEVENIGTAHCSAVYSSFYFLLSDVLILN